MESATEISMEMECWRSLGRAVLVRAILDYQSAKRGLVTATAANNEREIEQCQDVLDDCADFFRSNYCKVFSGIDGVKVLENIDEIRLPENPVELDALIRESPLQTLQRAL